MDIQDPHFWTAIALLIFLALTGKKAWTAATSALDKRAAQIRGQIEEAQKLRDEAQALLEEYQRKRRAAAGESREILEQAEHLAAEQARQAKTALEESLNRRMRGAMEKIGQAEAQAVAEIRAETVRRAVAEAHGLIKGALTEAKAGGLVDRAIADLPHHLRH
ncbi:MAG TPA: F0F1 ATP synthase subunit B [Dongiaceae bacterium]|jgi:F-type H+-transporting ATPase subunit b|nr:F0F1 ATP synthase subunit B [Dongiaceae bacterium]